VRPLELDTAWVALSLLRHVGSKTLRALIEHFGSAEAILQASPDELQAVRGVGKKIAEAIAEVDLPHTAQKIERWQQAGLLIVPHGDTEYPNPLNSLEDEPATLFIHGEKYPTPWCKSVAIVGTRHPSPEAKETAFQLGKTLAEEGWIVVSGMALGIDEAAHRGALSGKGTTVAVLGGGVLNIYPRQSQKLAEQIMQHGALISENAPDAEPSPPRLVSRNRIISGLSDHIIVVETEQDGGAMYAAKSALAQGRTLHAVGFPTSGNLHLLKEGAHYIAPNLDNFSL